MQGGKGNAAASLPAPLSASAPAEPAEPAKPITAPPAEPDEPAQQPTQATVRRMPPCFRKVKREPLNLPKPDRLHHLPAVDEAVRQDVEARRIILTPAQKAAQARKAAKPAPSAQPIAEQTAPSEPEPPQPQPQPQPALALAPAPAASVAAAAVAKPAKSRSKRATRLPDDWYLPRSWGEWAMQQGMTAEAIRLEAEKFADYWHSKAGQGATKLDWQATWRNWIRRASEQGRANAARPRRSTAADYLRVLEEIHARNRPYLENDEEENDDEENRRQMA